MDFSADSDGFLAWPTVDPTPASVRPHVEVAVATAHPTLLPRTTMWDDSSIQLGGSCWNISRKCLVRGSGLNPLLSHCQVYTIRVQLLYMKWRSSGHLRVSLARVFQHPNVQNSTQTFRTIFKKVKGHNDKSWQTMATWPWRNLTPCVFVGAFAATSLDMPTSRLPGLLRSYLKRDSVVLRCRSNLPYLLYLSLSLSSALNPCPYVRKTPLCIYL